MQQSGSEAGERDRRERLRRKRNRVRADGGWSVQPVCRQPARLPVAPTASHIVDLANRIVVWCGGRRRACFLLRARSREVLAGASGAFRCRRSSGRDDRVARMGVMSPSRVRGESSTSTARIDREWTVWHEVPAI